MANIYFHNPQINERAYKKMYVKLAIGASGAVTLSRGINVISASKTATGEITIVFPPFNSFVGADAMLESATAQNDSYQIKSSNPATGTIVLMTKISGVAADLASGSILHVDIRFKNTSVPN